MNKTSILCIIFCLSACISCQRRVNTQASQAVLATATPVNDQPALATIVPTKVRTTKPETARFIQSSQKLGFPETSQAALGDLDGDGDLDAVFANPMRNPAGSD